MLALSAIWQRNDDIRLGDVVVSSPGENHGVVFQYDMGKAIQGYGFQSLGHLNQPPALLRQAVGQSGAPVVR